MQIDDLVNAQCEWLKGTGPDANIAISTRVRLARNVAGNKYFDWADADERAGVLNKVMEVIKENPFFENALFLNIKDASDLDRAFLVERHLMSREHMQEVANKGLVVGEKEAVSVMINEEDHLRMQVLQSGFNIMEAWRIGDEIDVELGKVLSFDYSSKFGYLTSCPTNTGTGLRASVMVHLSALVMTGQVENVFDAISKLGLTMRGFYGEGTEALGDFFQISNQVALGHSEMDILDNLERIIHKIIIKEQATREDLSKRRKREVSDRVYRSYGTLKNARIITSQETIKLLSAIRLGIDMGFVTDIDAQSINDILLLAHPAHLQKMSDTDIAPYERDIKRADLVRARLREK